MCSPAGTGIQTLARTAAKANQDLVLRCLETSCWERAGTYSKSIDEYVIKWAVLDKAGSEHGSDEEFVKENDG